LNGGSRKVSRKPKVSKTRGKSRATSKSAKRRAPPSKSVARKRSGRAVSARRP
jgi:hypothetical protein